MSRGLDLARRELWRRRLREFDRGTATVAEFCRRVGVSDAAFYQWRHGAKLSGDLSLDVVANLPLPELHAE